MADTPEQSSDSEDMEIIDVPLPDVGEDMTPTTEMILQGKIGNGTFSRLDEELSKTLQEERRKNAVELKKSRVEAYNEGVKDTLESVGELQGNIVELGLELSKRLELGEALSRKELDTLRIAQSVGKDMVDRAIGKPKTTTEVSTKGSFLHIIAGVKPSE